MDWKRCIEKRESKQITADVEMAEALEKTSANKAFSVKELALREETVGAKLSLAYDAARELLEAIALRKGWKIYNHVCYTAFLREVMQKSEIAEEFDSLRKIRNDINYYGKEISVTEAQNLLDRLEALRQEILRLSKALP